MATPPPHRSVFSLLLRQLDAESLLGGGVQREGLGMFPGSSRFLEGRMEVGSMARAGGSEGGGGWGALYGLSLGHRASGQGEAPIQSLVQPHSCGLQGPQPPPFRPVHPLSRLVPGPTNEWSGLAGFPASFSSDRDGRRGGSERGEAETSSGGETPTQGGRERQRTGTDVPAAQREKQDGEGAAMQGRGGW